MPELKIKRIYQQAEQADGTRILVDGLWPRGIKKEIAHIDLWLKDIAPSSVLRTWFKHEPDKWQEFCKRYTQELNLKKESVQTILNYLKEGNVTLLYGAKDERYNNAVALKDYIEHLKG